MISCHLYKNPIIEKCGKIFDMTGIESFDTKYLLVFNKHLPQQHKIYQRLELTCNRGMLCKTKDKSYMHPSFV